MRSSCDVCKERFMCDRLLYKCPRGDDYPNANGKDELTDKDKEKWAETYIKSWYKVPRELEAYV